MLDYPRVSDSPSEGWIQGKSMNAVAKLVAIQNWINVIGRNLTGWMVVEIPTEIMMVELQNWINDGWNPKRN